MDYLSPAHVGTKYLDRRVRQIKPRDGESPVFSHEKGARSNVAKRERLVNVRNEKEAPCPTGGSDRSSSKCAQHIHDHNDAFRCGGAIPVNRQQALICQCCFDHNMHFTGGEEPGLRGGRARGKKVLTSIAMEA